MSRMLHFVDCPNADSRDKNGLVICPWRSVDLQFKAFVGPERKVKQGFGRRTVVARQSVWFRVGWRSAYKSEGLRRRLGLGVVTLRFGRGFDEV